MTFARARPAGFSFHSKLLSTEMETIDSQMPFALDTRGGTYTASTLIAIGGAGVEISGTGLSVTSALTIGAGAAVQFGAASTVAFLGTTTVSSGTLAFGVGSTLNISSPTVVFSGSTITLNTASIINISGGGGLTLAASSTAVFSGLVTFNNGPIAMGAVMNLTSTGHIVERTATGADANASYGVNDGDLVYRGGALTADRTWTITSTGATNGCRIRVYNDTYGFHVILVRDDASNICQLTSTGSESGYFKKWVDLKYISGRWEIIGGQLI